MNLGQLIEKLKVLAEDNRIPLDSEVEYTTVEREGYETQLVGAAVLMRYDKHIVRLEFQAFY